MAPDTVSLSSGLLSLTLLLVSGIVLLVSQSSMIVHSVGSPKNNLEQGAAETNVQPQFLRKKIIVTLKYFHSELLLFFAEEKKWKKILIRR
jgi:hypothetical protein